MWGQHAALWFSDIFDILCIVLQVRAATAPLPLIWQAGGKCIASLLATSYSPICVYLGGCWDYCLHCYCWQQCYVILIELNTIKFGKLKLLKYGWNAVNMNKIHFVKWIAIKAKKPNGFNKYKRSKRRRSISELNRSFLIEILYSLNFVLNTERVSKRWRILMEW